MTLIPRYSRQMLIGLTAWAGLVMSAPTLAQAAKPNHEGWYQVELIVFARTDDSGQEHWPNNIKLRYPGDWVELKDPNAITNAVNPDGSTASSTPAVDFTKEAFYLLPATERQLNTQAKKLENNSRYELLFHQAWRQVITNKKSSKAILIYGGQQFGPHQALEGSIRLSVATYLELQTNLWYSQFDVNVGQDVVRTWPEVPLRPNYQTMNTGSLTLDSNLAEALATENQQWESGNFEPNPTDTTAESATPDYLTRQVILLQQERDMRSGEVHYLDHPVLATIIQVTPYTQPTH